MVSVSNLREENDMTASYNHHSQVSIKDVMPGTLRPEVAARVAEVLGLEAFQYSEDYQWYAFEGDSEGGFIKITNAMAVAMHEFKIP